MDIPPHLLAQFIGVTNASVTLASQLLIDSGLNLDVAIASFFAIQEAGGLPNNSSDESPSNSPNLSTNPSAQDPSRATQPMSPHNPVASDEAYARAIAEEPEDEVRAPLPQVVETLLSAYDNPAQGNVPPPPPDPFQSADGARAEGLARLFRHPTHLNFSETFENAMTSGVRQNKWLLVNIQRSDIFNSLVMNRDVWSDREVEEVVQAHFVFWQREERTPDGARYKQFYWYHEVPHVALIDPRSGERLKVWGGDGEQINKRLLLTELLDFVGNNSLDSDVNIRFRAPSTRPSSRNTRGVNDGLSIEIDDTINVDDDMSEDGQLAAAIAASMEEEERKLSTENMEAGEAGAASSAAMNGVAHATGTNSARVGGGVTSSINDRGDRERATSRLMSATNPTLNRNRSLRAQQDDEFEQSLAMDRAIEESKKAEALRKEREAKEEEMRLREVEKTRKMKRRRVPPVPPPDCTEKITELAIRLPTGVRLQRRFLARNTVGNVYDFIESEVEELVAVNFELMTAYPKKSWTDLDVSLEELAPKAALVVHLKD